ncbi:MAG: glycosyltransferase [Smithellaceae bacterium]|nr:glycosyltransferase [Smithellaceae bacterium]
MIRNNPHIQVVSHPLVSVVMPVYNRVNFLADSIESILGQTYSHFEFIIVDDGSTDGSRDIIAAYAKQDKRVRIIFNNQPDYTGAMNDGVRIAEGQWIARMESDDIALPERLAMSLVWADHRGLDVCGGQVETFGAEGPILWFPEDHKTIEREFLFRCPMLHPTIIVRSTILKDNLYAANCVFDDYELFSRLVTHYRLGNTPQVLLRYRRHGGQASVIRRTEIQQDLQKYRFRYFYEMYPQTPLADYLALARVSDRLPLRTSEELERAGRWLAELADGSDQRTRQQMAERWMAACDRSAALGDKVDSIYHRFQSQIIPPDVG